VPTAYVGLGSNLGNREDLLLKGLLGLCGQGMPVQAVSSVYESVPVGKTDQPDFLNAVARVETALGAREALGVLLGLEHSLGRVRVEKWGPRVLDLDLLLFGDESQEIISEPGLQVPHPLLQERGFVLLPLCDLNPHGVHPLLGVSFQSLADACGSAGLRVFPDVDLNVDVGHR